jgi:hypothetical protein
LLIQNARNEDPFADYRVAREVKRPKAAGRRVKGNFNA